MKRNQTDGIVLWMRLRSIPASMLSESRTSRMSPDVLRQEERRFTLHRRTGHIPDFLSGIELRSHGRGVRSPGLKSL